MLKQLKPKTLKTILVGAAAGATLLSAGYYYFQKQR